MKKILAAVLFAGIIFINFSRCSKNDDVTQPVKTFVIVPGAWQAPYAWQMVKINLEGQGYKVIVVQLPGHGSDTTPPQTLSMDAYRDKVISAMDSVTGKVILVGHSLAGMIISAVAEKVPTRIQKLVYIGAYLPKSGQSLLDLANTDANSLLGKSLSLSADSLTLDVKHDNITNIFIQDGTAAIQQLVLSNYRIEPSIPFNNKVLLTTANFGSVSKLYIHTLQDHAVTIDLQNRMVAAAGVTAIDSINSSHSPFLSKPDSVGILLIHAIK